MEGITNLLWTLILAGGSWVSGLELPELASGLGILCGALVAPIAYLWSYRELAGLMSSRWAASCTALVAPLLVVIAPGFAFYSASGLEVPLFALLVTGGLCALSQAKSRAALMSGSALLGLAAMTRPEGALVLACGAAACALTIKGVKGSSVVDRLGRFFAATLPGAAVIAAFTLWRLHYYGSLLQNTAYAKAGGLEVAERWGLPYVLDAAQGNWFVIAWLLALGGALVDRDFGARSLAVLAIVPLWCAYVVYVGGDYMPFHRLVLPLLPALYILGVTGFARIFGAVPASSFGLPRASRVISVALLAAALAFPLIVEYPEQLEAEKARQEEIQRDTERRRALGEWFAEHEPEALVAKNAVGAFGYYSDVRIVDMLGLNDEHIAHRGTKEPEYLPGHQAGDGPYVLSREPGYIDVTSTEPEFRFVSDRELANSAEFLEEYHPVTVKLDGGRQNYMFKRNEAEDSPAGLNSENQRR